MKLKRVLKNLLVVVVSILVTVFLIEFVLRAVYKFKFSPRGTVRIPIAKTYKLSENKHLLYELKPNSKARVNGIDFGINAFGFRDKKYRIRKANELRVIFIGDSVTYGWNVALEDTYHKRLERLFHSNGYDVDVMGMGVVGYNTEQEYFLIKEKALVFKPDMIVLQITMNDFERTLGIKTYQEGRYLRVIPYHDYSIPFMIKKTKLTYSLMKHFHLFKFVNLKLSWLKEERDPQYTHHDVFMLGEENSFRYFRKISDLLDNEGIRFAVAVFPFRQFEDSYPLVSLHQRIQREFKGMDVPCLDLHETLNGEGRDDFWGSRLHPNTRGYEVVSQAMFDFLAPFLKEGVDE
jgi:lysophospholipase L1-like esterase